MNTLIDSQLFEINGGLFVGRSAYDNLRAESELQALLLDLWSTFYYR